MSPLDRAQAFCQRFGLRVPILLAPMAGACPPGLSAAVANAGGMGACGALLMQPDEILDWARAVRGASNGAFQMNIWVPDRAPDRNPAHEAEVRRFLADWGPAVPETAGDQRPPDFDAQCEAILACGAPVVSSIMGLFPPEFVTQMKARGVAWFATVTTLGEARAAEAAGADAIIAQGMEAGGHRGAFEAAEAERHQVGVFALVPAIADAVDLPVVAAGAISDGRGVAAALTLGASAVVVGTGFLRTPEAGIARSWADALAAAAPEGTMLTRAFSGRAGRSLATAYVEAAARQDAPGPAPYPVQRGLTAAMRKQAAETGDLDRLQAWAGQSSALARAEPAADIVRALWEDAQRRLRGETLT